MRTGKGVRNVNLLMQEIEIIKEGVAGCVGIVCGCVISGKVDGRVVEGKSLERRDLDERVFRCQFSSPPLKFNPFHQHFNSSPSISISREGTLIGVCLRETKTHVSNSLQFCGSQEHDRGALRFLSI